MSKRFGRNQRRHAREAIANLQETVAMDRALLARQRLKVGTLEEELDDAKRTAARMSILFKPEEMALNIKTPHPGQPLVLPVIERLDMGSIMDFDKEGTLQTVPLHLLMTEVSEDAMKSAMHVRVKFFDGEVCYGMTETALHSMPDERLFMELTRNMARQLIPQLSERRKRR